MRKWFVGLMMLLALVLMAPTAMAFYKDAICPKCKVEREFVRTDDYCWIPKEDMHMRVYRCPVCDRRQGMGKMSPHEESKPATCVSGAYCALCKRYFGGTNPNNHEYTIVYNKVDEYNHFKKEVCSGCKKLNTILTEQHRQKEAATCVSGAICADCGEAYGSPIPNAHNWTEWQPHMSLPNVHYRYCQNAGCSAYETEPHDGNSNCVTSATCSKCKATYKDTTKHKGPLTYTYEKENENFHKKIESCDACGKRTGSFVSTKHVEKSPANCTYAAFCAVCESYYGGINPDNHDWNKWVCKDENQHYRICINNDKHIQYADHRGLATCIVTMPCLDCGQPYNDPDKHQGPYTYAYAPSASSATKHTVTETCTSCGKTSRKYDEAHDTVRHAPQAPTCKAEGWKSYETCKHCTYSTYSAIKPDPNAHVGKTRTIYVRISEAQHEPHMLYDCCGKLELGSPEAHTPSTAATCTAAAYCAVCKSSYGGTDPNVHNLVQHDAQAPTCTAIGWDAYETCSRCDYTTYVEKSKLGHERVSHDAQEPTCTEIGWDAYETCSRCDYTTYVEKSKLGHERLSHDAQAPTCTEIGWDAYETCSRCDYTTYAEKSALGHERVSHGAQEPTCTEIGWDAYETCSRCDYTTYAEKSALGHDRVNHDAQEPTCTEIGWDAYETCSRCDYTTYAEKSALGHERVSHDAQAPTCTAIGWDAYETCSRCDYTTYAEKSALGHERVSHDAQEPTCTEIGWDAYETCSRCDYTTYVEKSKLGHDRVSHGAQEPTCTETGWDAYETCSRCDYTTYAEKSALGHERVSHDAQEPTCTEIGWDAYETCSRCDYTTYAEKSALGHDYDAKTTKPTFTVKGYTTHTCTRCQDSYRDGFVPALGHWYGEWAPNADGTHSATCRRDGSCARTVNCARIPFVLLTGDVRTELVLCPVCGEISQIRKIDENGETVGVVELDGEVRLLLVEDALAKAHTERLPAGELVLRMSTRDMSENLLSVAFERSGKLIQPTGQVKITLPAELLAGYTLSLLSEDGTETELALEADEKAETVFFVLDFTDSEIPVQVIRLVPEV